MMPDLRTRAVEVKKNWLLKLSGGIVGLATGAEVLGKSVNAIKTLRHFVIETVGLPQMLTIHQALVVIVGALLLAGYAAGAWWLYLKIRTQQARLRIAYLAIAVVGMGTMAWVNYKIIPPRPDSDAYLRQERVEWEQRVLAASQEPKGGIRVTSLDQAARPQVWTTAQVLSGVLSGDSVSDEDAARIRRAFDYMEQARLPGSGGWGYFEDWPWSITEVTSWVVLAESLSLETNVWRTPADRATMAARVVRDLKTVGMSLQDDKGWSPIISSSSGLSRTYSTIMATLAVSEALKAGVGSPSERSDYEAWTRDGVDWLFKTFKTEPRSDSPELMIGWVPNPFRTNQQESFLGLNAQALYAAERSMRLPHLNDLRLNPTFSRAVEMFLAEPSFESRSIGMNDRLHDSDRYLPANSSLAPVTPVAPAASSAHLSCSCPITIEGSTFLWYPWSVAAARALADDQELAPEQRQRATSLARRLVERLSDASSFVSGGFNYVNAEFLITVLPARPAAAPLPAAAVRASLR